MSKKITRRQNVVVATGLPDVNRQFFGNEKMQKAFNVLQVVENRGRINDALANHPNADVLLVSDGLTGDGESLNQIMIDMHMAYKNLRIVYITSGVNSKNKQSKMRQLGYLVRVGIYDIVSEDTITMMHILKALIQPADKEDVSWIFRYIDSEEANTPKDKIQVETVKEEEVDESRRGAIPNLTMFSSIKPGTGKSFISVNVATAIAKYGVKNKDGKPPKVALIDGDMQNLSIGTLLGIDDDDKNLKTVIDKIQSILDSKGEEIDDPARVADVRAFVRSSFVQYKESKNLHVLAGSQLQWDMVQDFTGNDFIWLLNVIREEYDVIIMDSSSSLNHVSTVPLMLMSHDLYYILNLDWNNIHNNGRYQKTLIDYGVFDKVHYILNENVSVEPSDGDGEELLLGEKEVREQGFDIKGSIPMINKITFLNRIVNGVPIVLDTEPETLEARVGILRIANRIWEIERLSVEEERFADRLEKLNGTKSRGLGFFRK